ncbi:hypothetical protein MYX35_05615 [Borreliella burgdorferi]|uniref:hypothetical protein n=1 Tax=Borreliella burgdorferi TaxID=139 RepID=UPI000D040798|nr:hypothetical protein [Borreliella burgdorferi]MDK7383926.1 hypothetical protein [Borreliella burgdorferi]PRR43173.1 hypothetical protein CV670_05080 [Borreliella burgdorferi]PRR45485.1 hypothetical protein CV673_05080 [Borreliella burgdorferi]
MPEYSSYKSLNKLKVFLLNYISFNFSIFSFAYADFKIKLIQYFSNSSIFIQDIEEFEKNIFSNKKLKNKIVGLIIHK